jgi:DNA-binding NarL/FixJ family response regulator
MKPQINIGIAEDHHFVREGLVALLKEQEGINVVFDVANGQELLDILKTNRPDVILLDLEMPVVSGKEAFEKIRQRYPKLKVIIISAFFEEQSIIEYVKKGVNAYLPKNSKIDKIVDAIFAVHEQGAYFDNKVSMMLAKQVAEPVNTATNTEEEITERDRTIIKLICQNRTSKEIASHLNMGVKAVEYNRARIMRKTNSKNVTALITYAVKHRIISIQ